MNYIACYIRIRFTAIPCILFSEFPILTTTLKANPNVRQTSIHQQPDATAQVLPPSSVQVQIICWLWFQSRKILFLTDGTQE